jgi:hypothetical protein
MTAKFVIRLLDKDGRLLGWQEVEARGRDGVIRTPACLIPVDITGESEEISFHWCDLNVEARQGVRRMEVVAGQAYSIPPIDVLRIGEVAHDLPPVTTRGSVVIGVPTGSLSAAGNS